VERVGDEVIVKSEDGFTTITMNRPERRNALSLELMGELTAAFAAAGADEGRGVILAGNGPVFSAGHDFADLAGADLPALERLLAACTELMTTMQAIPQPVVARVHGLATAAGCQLVATADLAVAADTASFAIPGGKGGWFCHTPLVAVGRNLGRKRALEMAMTGDPIDAATAADWGLVNRVVPEEDLEEATLELLRRATRGSAASKGLGKQAFYAQVELPQTDAYRYAMDVMARAGTSPEAQEGFAAFLEKRTPRFGQ
jgi:enoyl-CoA hydratase/carnithine racemase